MILKLTLYELLRQMEVYCYLLEVFTVLQNMNLKDHISF